MHHPEAPGRAAKRAAGGPELSDSLALPCDPMLGRKQAQKAQKTESAK
jgi:hypothetical protein